MYDIKNPIIVAGINYTVSEVEGIADRFNTLGQIN